MPRARLAGGYGGGRGAGAWGKATGRAGDFKPPTDQATATAATAVVGPLNGERHGTSSSKGSGKHGGSNAGSGNAGAKGSRAARGQRLRAASVVFSVRDNRKQLVVAFLAWFVHRIHFLQ